MSPTPEDSDEDVPVVLPDPPNFLPTRPEEIVWLAEQVLANPTQRAVIDRVGLHGDLTEAEDRALDAFVEARVAARGWGLRHPFTLSLAGVLARRFVAGLIDDLVAPEVAAFVARNTNRQAPDYKPIPVPHLREILLFAETLWDDPEMARIFEESKAAPGFDDEQSRVYRTFRKRFAKKYGLLNRRDDALSSGMILNRMVHRGQIERFTDEAAMEFLRRHQGTVVANCVFDGPSNV